MTRGTEAATDPGAGSGTDGRARERGFTMVELVAVIAIVTLLAAVILPQVASQQTSANPAALGSELRNIQTAAEMFQVHTRTATPGE
ncbi:MAG: type II secretion system protein, partial [Gemmatimonadota bacterium]